MKHEMTFFEYTDFINHLFLQRLVDFDFYENVDNGSTADALTVVEEDDD